MKYNRLSVDDDFDYHNFQFIHTAKMSFHSYFQVLCELSTAVPDS